MKKKYILLLMIITLFSSGLFAQVSKINPSDPHQKTLKLEKITSKKDAISEFGKKYNLDENNTFVENKETSDFSGMTHQRNQQYYKGIKVEFGTAITHSRDGQVETVNGELYEVKNLNINPALSAESCFLKAINYLPASKYAWEDDENVRAANYKKPSGELVILPLINTGDIKLAYKFDIFCSTPVAREEIYVDANTGNLLFRNPLIKHATGLVSSKQAEAMSKKIEDITVGSKSAFATLVPSTTAATRYNGTQTIETTFVSGSYVLNDLSRGGGVMTYNSENTNTMPSTNFIDATNTWNSGNYTSGSSTNDNAALSAHWGAEVTYDFWKNIMGRNSFDDNNGQIKNYVHFNNTNLSATGWDNANWDGAEMRYGDGNSFDVLTAIDVIGHEIGHGVCQYTAGLVYANQSGAMNEGFSDIWGTCIEQYGTFGNLNAATDTASPGTSGVWKIGEKLAASPLRSMSYPLTRGNPDTFLGTNYTDTQDDTGISPACTTPNSNTNDNCGVHNNSGVLNHWFYLLTAGSSGTKTNNASVANGGPDTYNVTGIGMTKAAQIAYYAERDYLTANAKFTDARNATIAVASSLYCATSPEVQAVTKAWFAVNVGADYVGLANDVSLKFLTTTSSISCGSAYSSSIVFENAGTANITSVTVSYTIDGGAAVNSTWNGTLANCSTQAYPLTITGLTRGTHTLSVTTTIVSDGNATNNTKTSIITVNDNGTVGTTNTFNATTDALVTLDASGKTSTVWERGTLTTKTKLTNAIAGSQVYATKLTAATYPVGVESYLVSQCYNISNLSSPTVSFDMAFDLEPNYDFITLDYSTDGGTTWSILGTAADVNWYNSGRLPSTTDCDACPGKQWTGNYATAPTGGTGVNGNKRNYSHSLSPFGSGGATPASSMMFRFNFYSDGGVVQEGAFVDNFLVQGTLSTQENEFENFGVYPNPSNGLFNVVLSTSDKVNITLHDLRGRSIYNETFSSNGSVFNKELNFSTLSSGIYMLNVESEGKKASKKIIIK
ncbi:M4 family metallopeptidase [Flavobacterium sp.]|uniref:M4 family metallopeptidase n=1 Tax=Flavobacterium sp. TaxID=239 RepID=UPI0038FC354B